MGRIALKVDEYYKDVKNYNNYGKLKKFLLYPTTMIKDSLLGTLFGVATGLSINILTNFLNFDSDTLIEFLLIVVQFISAIGLNVSLIAFAIRCSSLKENLEIDYSQPKSEREVAYKESLLQLYDEKYKKIRFWYVLGIIFFVLVVLSSIVVPIVQSIIKVICTKKIL